MYRGLSLMPRCVIIIIIILFYYKKYQYFFFTFQKIMLIPTIAFCFLFITTLMKLHNRYLMNIQIKYVNICDVNTT